MQPFYTLYRNKLSLYYQSMIMEDEKKKMKALNLLDSLDRRCGQ